MSKGSNPNYIRKKKSLITPIVIAIVYVNLNP